MYILNKIKQNLKPFFEYIKLVKINIIPAVQVVRRVQIPLEVQAVPCLLVFLEYLVALVYQVYPLAQVHPSVQVDLEDHAFLVVLELRLHQTSLERHFHPNHSK